MEYISKQFVNNSQRIRYWDAFRGIACILVFSNHFAGIFFPELFFVTESSSRFAKIWDGTPLNVLTNGNMAVQFFYCISAFLIARQVMEKKELALKPRIFWNRLKKMYLLSTPAIVLSYIFAKTGLYTYKFETSSLGLMHTFQFEHSFIDMSKEAMKVGFTGICKYNPPLWTISRILLGGMLVSFIIYGIESIKSESSKKIVLL